MRRKLKDTYASRFWLLLKTKINLQKKEQVENILERHYFEKISSAKWTKEIQNTAMKIK